MIAANDDHVEAHIRAWLEGFVVGLNLCPFARPLLGSDNLRIAICWETEQAALLRAFLRELDLLQGSTEGEIATTLLAFPRALASFDDYLAVLDEAQYLLREAGLEGLVQLASFHPRYRFEGEADNAASHYSNRAPYPLLHMLREDMLTRVLAGHADPDRIPARNVETLDAIGVAELARRWQKLFET